MTPSGLSQHCLGHSGAWTLLRRELRGGSRPRAPELSREAVSEAGRRPHWASGPGSFGLSIPCGYLFIHLFIHSFIHPASRVARQALDRCLLGSVVSIAHSGSKSELGGALTPRTTRSVGGSPL